MDVGSCRFLNFRSHLLAYSCPHCQRYDNLKAHGFLKSTSGEIRGIRLYCSNRRNHGGCGHTYSIYFEDRIPHATLGAAQVGEILEAAHGSRQTQEGSTTMSTPLADAVAAICSKSTAYRWIDRFRDLQGFSIKPLVFEAAGREEGPYTGPPEQMAWKRMREAFGGVSSAVGTMQKCFQNLILPPRPKCVRPKYHSPFSEVLAYYLMATGIETTSVPECGYFGLSTRRRLSESG
jgi:hypothetical protein